MAPLAGRDDYESRYGEYENGERLLTLLSAASSFVREVAHCQIGVGTDLEETFTGGGHRLFLANVPVSAITEVTVNGDTLATDRYTWTPWGRLEYTDDCWAYEDTVVVTYDHGQQPPEWVVDLVCSMVQRALRPAAVAGEQSVTTGSQTVSYFTSAAGVSLWMTKEEKAKVRAIRDGVVFA